MKMIAIGTVHGHKLVKERDKTDPKSRNKFEDLIAKPGETFDTEEFGIDKVEADSLIKNGAAKRKTREVPDDGDGHKLPKRGAHQQTSTDGLDEKSDEELRLLAVAKWPDVPADATREQVIARLRAAKA